MLGKLSKIIGIISLVCVLYFLFLLWKEISDIPPLIETQRHLDLTSSALGPHYEDYTRKYTNNRQDMTFDSAGVPLLKRNGEPHYHPVYIAQFALGAYEYYLKHRDQDAEKAFLNSANWLKNNLRPHGQFSFWPYTFEHPVHEGSIMPPWFSAMAQGEGASVLLRAYCMTRDDSFLSTAKRALHPLSFDLSAGGLSLLKNGGFLFPQEYSSPLAADVLNGAISAYFGVYDYYRVTHDPEIETLASSILNALASNLPHYDAGYWSYYELQPKLLAGYHYHRVHINQLHILYQLSDNNVFLEYSKRFEAYYNSPWTRARFVVMNHVRQLQLIRHPKDINRVITFIREYIAH